MAIPNERNKRPGILKMFNKKTGIFTHVIAHPGTNSPVVHNCPCEAEGVQLAVLEFILREILERRKSPELLPTPDDFRYDYLDEAPPEFKEPVVSDTHLADSIVRKIIEGTRR